MQKKINWGELGIEPRASRMLCSSENSVYRSFARLLTQSENHTTRPHALILENPSAEVCTHCDPNVMHIDNMSPLTGETYSKPMPTHKCLLIHLKFYWFIVILFRILHYNEIAPTLVGIVQLHYIYRSYYMLFYSFQSTISSFPNIISKIQKI